MTWTGLLPVIIFLIIAIAMSLVVRRAVDKRRAQAGDGASSSSFINEYFLGNRSLGGFVLAMTCVATYGSVSSFVGGPGQAWDIGFGWVYMATVQVTALILLYGIMGKKMALVSRKTGSVTVIDIIRQRYHSNVLAVLSAIIIIAFFAATMIAQFVGGAKLFEAVTGYSYEVGLLLFGTAAILFTTIGGFRGVALTDALCGIVMLLGLGVLAYGILSAGGGLENIMLTIEANHPEMLEPLSDGDMPWTLYFTQWLLVGVFTFCLPQSTVRCMGAKSTKSIKRAMIIGTVVIGAMMIVSTSLGVLAAGILPGTLADYGSVDNIIPLAIVQSLPPVVAGIAIVGPIAASISTVSSLLIASSSVLVKDLKLGLHARKGREGEGAGEGAGAGTGSGMGAGECAGERASERAGETLAKKRTVMVVSQLTTLFLGVLVFVLSLVPPEVIWKINMFAFGGLETAFCCVLVGGLFWRRATKQGAIASMGLGVLAYCVSMALGFKLFGMHQIVLGMLVAVMAMVVVSLLTKSESEETLRLFFPPKKEKAAK